MTFNRIGPALATAACLFAATTAVHAQTLPQNGSYVLETKPSPGCPAVVLHLVRENETVSGVVFFKDGSGLSSVMGQTNGRAFNWTLTPVRGDGPKGQVSGQVTSEGALSAHLEGTNCTLNTVVPVYQGAPVGNG